MNAILRKAATILNKTFHVEKFLDNAVAISFNPNESPFALVIMEEDAPNTLYYSVAVDAPDPHSVADIALRLIHIAKTELAEPFLMNLDGEILWSQDAYEHLAQTVGPIEEEAAELLYNLESPGKLPN